MSSENFYVGVLSRRIIVIQDIGFW